MISQDVIKGLEYLVKTYNEGNAPEQAFIRPAIIYLPELIKEVKRLQAENKRLENELEEIAQMGMDRDFAESRDED